MSLDQFKNRNSTGYIDLNIEHEPKTTWQKFIKVVKRTFKGELFVGLWIVLLEMLKGKKNRHTTQYPQERLPISPRYRAIHTLLRLLESGTERCIGCGLCEKICPSNCIRMDTKVDVNGRKEVKEYTINFGRCVFCGLCAEVCPELAIGHGNEYENISEQRALFSFKKELLTSHESFKKGEQEEFEGYGSLSYDCDKFIKNTPIMNSRSEDV